MDAVAGAARFFAALRMTVGGFALPLAISAHRRCERSAAIQPTPAMAHTAKKRRWLNEIAASL